MTTITKFRLNTEEAKISGVCAGLSDRFGWDVTWIRIGAVVVTLLGGFPWTLVGYGLTAWIATPKSADTLTRLG